MGAMVEILRGVLKTIEENQKMAHAAFADVDFFLRLGGSCYHLITIDGEIDPLVIPGQKLFFCW